MICLRTSRIVTAALLALIVAPAAAATDSPFVWQVQGPHARHCLIGTVHALPGSVPLPDNIARCYAAAHRVVIEAIASNLMDRADYVRRLGDIAEREPGGLRQRIGEPLYARVSALAQKLQLDVHQLDSFRPWFAAEMLDAFCALPSLARASNGIDVQLARRAGQDRKPLLALETDAAHDEILTRMPADASIEDLQQTLDAADRGDAPGFTAMWLAGDENSLKREVESMLERYPALHRRLLAERNQAWLPRVRELINGDEPVLIAAGVAHFIGPGSLRQLLAQARIATTELRSPPQLPAADPTAVVPGR